jgi:hypothetical protein
VNVKTVASVGSKCIFARLVSRRDGKARLLVVFGSRYLNVRLFVVSISLIQNRLLCNGSIEKRRGQ